MRSPALAIALSIRSRRRTSFIVSAAMLATVAISVPLLATVVPVGTIAVASSVPLAGVLVSVMNCMLFAEDEGNLSSRFPRHTLTLPVRTRTLAFWPMFLTSSCAALLWVAVAVLIYRPAGYPIPVLIPALGLAALMAWAQALTWLPINILWFREILNVALVTALGALPVWLTITGRGSRGSIITLLIVYLATAAVLGWAAVTSDRRGQTWRFWPEHSPFASIATPLALARRRRPFRSPFEAQLWYEWNCHGVMLNGFVGAILFMIWGVLFGSGGRGGSQWFATIVVLLLVVVVVTICASGTSFGRFRPFWSRTRGFETLMAVRPMSSGRLVAAKIRMSAASVLWNWALAAAGTTFWIVASGNSYNAAIVARDLFNQYPGGRGFAIIALACVLLPALSWKLLTEALVPVLTGRRWVADSSVYLYLSLFAGLICCGFWVTGSSERLVRFNSALPWVVLGTAILKGIAAIAAFRATLRQGLMAWRHIAGVLSLWLVLTGCGLAMAILVGPVTFVQIPWPIVGLGVATFVPLARFPLGTLALDWNRHR